MTAASLGTFGGESREVRVEDLLGRRLRDVTGQPIGRIEEIIAEIRGTEMVVTEVHVGPGALLERLVDLTSLVPMLARIARRGRKRYRVPWEQLDVSQPDRPRAFVRRHEVEQIEP